MDGKSQAWRDAADKLLEALARENKYIVADMLIIFLESADYGLKDYTPLGGVFKRAAKKGIIKKVDISILSGPAIPRAPNAIAHEVRGAKGADIAIVASILVAPLTGKNHVSRQSPNSRGRKGTI